jgi:hypothetical protein
MELLLRRFSFTLLLMTLTTLVACGGGEGGLSVDGGDDGEVSNLTLVLSIDDTNINNANPASVTATLQNNGTPLSGKVISFSTTLGVLDPLSGTALTDVNGQATIDIHAGETEGAGEITASYSDVDSSAIGFTSAGDGNNVAGRVVVVSSSNINVTSATPATLTATVSDNGENVVGEVVTFTTTLGVLDPNSGTALTDINGQATIVLTAGTKKGAGIISVTTSSGEVNTLGFSTEGDGSEEVGNSLTITSFTNSTSISNAAPASVIIHFEQADGTDLANEVITFTSTLGTLDPVTGTVLTNSTGDATIALSAGTIRGAGVLTASSGAGDAATQGFFTEGDGSEEGGDSLTITSFTNSTSISNAAPASVTIHFEQANGTDLTNEVITFTSTLGTLDPVTATALTDFSGNATITLSAGDVLGAGVLTATSSAGDTVTQGFFTQGDEPSIGGNSLTITGFSNSTAISNATPASVTIHFEQADGTDLSNEVITFTTTLGALDPGTGTVLTNGTGDATIILSAGTVHGAGVITAISNAGDVVTQGFFTEGDGAAQNKTINLAISSTNASFSNPVTLTATVLDKGVPVPGKLVEFSLDQTLAGLLTSEYAYTDNDGKATVTLSSDDMAGIGIVTVNVVGGADSGADDYYGYAKSSFIAAGDGAVQEKTIDLAITSPNLSAATPATLTAKVLDKGIPVTGRIVQFSTTIGYFDPSVGLVYQYVFTDDNGEASITLKADNVAGNGVVTASISDECCYGIAQVGFISTGDGALQEKTINLDIDSTSVSAASPASLKVTVLNNNIAVEGEVVTFTSALGEFMPASGTVLTDSNGQAVITLLAGDIEGAAIVTATTSTGESANIGYTTLGDGVGSGVNISLTLTDANGNEIEQISSISPGKLTATITGVTKAVIVTFNTDIGSIPIQTAIATVGSGYIATVDLLAGNSLGAGTVTAELATGESENLIFSIGASSLGMGNALDVNGDPDGLIDVPVGAISAGATAGLSVKIWDVSNSPAVLFTTETVEVTFSSGCSGLSVPTAKIDSPVGTIAGVAQSTYLAQGCEGDDIVTATANAGGIVLSATGTVIVSPAAASSIEFVSATPENISLKGVGGIESSTVVFRVRDSNGNVVANKDVDFSLNTDVGGVDWSPKAAKTDSNGLVQTVVNSGTVHTSVRVRAELNEDSSIFTQSSLLVISTGIPDQDSFSLSASVFNPEAWNIDGTEVTITARLADAFNNPAPDGTAVAFTTEGGSIGDSCVTAKGVCSVIWTSQNVRPEGQELGEVNNGPTLIQSIMEISKGFDFTGKQIAFSVSTLNGTDNISLNADFESKAELLASTNALLTNSGVKAVSGFEDIFELISTEGLDITIADSSVGSVTTLDVLGIGDGTTYYNNATQILGLTRINQMRDGKDFSINDIEFTVSTNEGTTAVPDNQTDTVILDKNYSTTAAIVSSVNAAIGNTSVIASEFVENGISYLKLATPSGLGITLTDQGGTSSTSAELGIDDGNATLFVGTSVLKNTYAGKDFSINDIEFAVETIAGTDIVILNDNNDTPSEIVGKVNTDLATSSVVASEFIYAGDTYLLLTSPTRLNIKITNGAGTVTTFSELGIVDGTTFASRVNSSLPRTTNFMGQKYGGRATISATAIGEESFPDFNGNGLYDDSEKDAFLGNVGNSGLDVNGVPYDLAESFIDYNEDGIYNPQVSAGDGETGGEQEKFDDFNSSSDFNLKDNEYNGSLCGTADNCSIDKSINVRGSLVLVMSGSNPRFVTNYPTNGDSINIVQDGTSAASVTIADFHNQPMPAGTSVTFNAAVGSIKGIGTYTWPNTNFNGGSSFSVTVEGVEDKNISGPLVVTVTTPSGVATSYTVATINITTS